MELKRTQTHLIPTKDSTLIGKRKTDGKLEYCPAKTAPNNMHWTSQYLYFTTDESIKEGDWILYKENFLDGTVKTYTDYVNAKWVLNKCSQGDLIYVDRAKYGKNAEIGLCGVAKITLSTDPKLTEQDDEYSETKNLPKPSPAFIKKYCELGGIDEVDVELEECCGDVEFCDFGDGFNCAKALGFKLNSHNEAAIHEIKKSWTKEELIGNQDRSLDEFLLNSNKYTQEERELVMNVISDWIK